MSDIYNKNAREKALLEEAYTNIYNEEFNPRRDAPEHSEGDPHPAQRSAESIIGAQVMWDGMMKRGQVEEVDVENGVAVVVDEDGGDHIVELGDFDVVLPVEDAESREERADVDKYEYEQGKEAGEREDNIEYARRHRDHSKGVKMALEALEMFKDELHTDGHPEDVNVNELADAHDQLSRALHFLLDETDVEYIIGGRATQRSEAQSQPEQFGDHGGHDYDSWHEFMRDYEEHGN